MDRNFRVDLLLRTRPHGRHARKQEVAETTRPPRYLRRAKVSVALAISLLAGVGSYALTYHVLVLMSEPAATAWVAPVASVGPGLSHAATTSGGPVR
jgi:hypothetical protein